MPGRRYGRGVAAVAVLAAVGACGSLPERRDAVTLQVTRFERLLAAGRYAPLCGTLAPATREELEHTAEAACARAIGEEELPPGGAVRQVDVYGAQARVVLEHDTVFLSHFPDGWKVTAAGCLPRPERPYQCAIEGG
ncbi:hypothetical protein [Streptomyces sp. NPDC052610]|uniref:hypothetical protein n=1 Tax=Streptomyces sp. NPDC052610 TaxID=3154952 RepID=UPI0034376DDA